MGRKCIPGFFCIENMSLFIICFLLLIIFYFILRSGSGSGFGSGSLFTWMNKDSDNKIIVISPPPPPSLPIHTSRKDPFNDPYAPPLQRDEVYIPPPVPTRGYGTEFQQIGILTRTQETTSGESMILPLMGRRNNNGRDKFQYYTISNTGSLNTKLPIRFHGKSGMSEYGCDEIFNGDEIFVEGYNTSFRTTIYENGTFRYIQ
jgi:hypothetical protein